MIFKNPYFHNFLFYENNILTDFICIYRLDTQNKTVQRAYKNGFIYLLFFDKYNMDYINTIMDSISAFVYDKNNEIFDIISVSDIFPSKIIEDYKRINFLKSTMPLNYYFFIVFHEVKTQRFHTGRLVFTQ